jgi:hypothetical protein
MERLQEMTRSSDLGVEIFWMLVAYHLDLGRE